MDVKTLSKIFCNHMNTLYQRDDAENGAIQYGLELVLDTLLKLLFLIALGFFIGKEKETLVILGVFCGLRLQAGGVHAKTSTGCTICMTLIWGASLMGHLYVPLSDIMLGYMYMIFLCIIIYCAPRTSHIEYFSKEIICRKKLYAVLLLTVFMLVGYLNRDVRGMFVYPVIWEMITLLFANKKHEKEE